MHLVYDKTTGEIEAFDVPCALTYHAELQKRGWMLSGAIWSTHHHRNHKGGSLNLKQMVGVKMYGPANEKVLRMDRLKGLSNLDLATDFLRSMPSFQLGSTSVLNWQLQQRYMLCQA